MKITIELPEPSAENIEETLAEQYTQLVTVARAMLADYKKNLSIQVPRISITLPAKLKKVKELTPAQEFTRTLLKHHMERIPTAHAGKQAACLARMYESGHTNVEAMLKLYDEHAEEYHECSWFTVFYWLKNGGNAASKPDDMEFKRKQLNEEEIEALKTRMGVDTDKKV